jgi:hypothetical protein
MVWGWIKGGFMKKGFPLKVMDMVVILLALGLTGVSAFAAYIQPGDSPQVVINGSGQEWIFPLDTDETVEVPGPLGITVVKIQDNQAWVESSPCTNQVCVAGGHINAQGDWVACLPNNVFLMVEGKEVRRHVLDSTSW